MSVYLLIPEEPEYVEAITFDEFIEYGKKNSNNIVNGMPWSFTFKECPVTHETDECYLISSIGGTYKFTPNQMLMIVEDGDAFELVPEDKDVFEQAYKLIKKTNS